MRSRMAIRTNEELDPNEGPGFGCFIWQAILFAGILFLIPIGVFSLHWPVWLLSILMFIDLILLFFVSMTAVFLLRVFFAGRRTTRGRTFGPPAAEIELSTTDAEPIQSADQTDEPAEPTEPTEPQGSA